MSESSKEQFNEKRDIILDAAAKVFARYGYNKTTLDDIADKVGIKKNSLYYYFNSKESLFDELISMLFEKTEASVKKSMSKFSTAEEKLGNLYKVIELASKDKTTFHDLTIKAYLETVTVVKKQVKSFRYCIKQMMIDIMNDGIASGEFIGTDTEKLATALVETYESLEYSSIFQSSSSEIEFVSEVDFSRPRENFNILLKFVIKSLKNNK